MAEDRLAAEYLQGHGTRPVAMEATGVDWITWSAGLPAMKSSTKCRRCGIPTNWPPPTAFPAPPNQPDEGGSLVAQSQAR